MDCQDGMTTRLFDHKKRSLIRYVYTRVPRLNKDMGQITFDHKGILIYARYIHSQPDMHDNFPEGFFVK
uniref:Uncharacterized protein n=1 Tax=Romanomermis culicivorax TaxID=13658 RepID=A0A915JV34_ROMCU